MLVLLFLLIFQTGHTGIEIKNAWIRPGAQGMNTALYLDIINNGNSVDTLYDAKSSAAKIVEIHETYSSGDMMGMRKTKGIEIKPNSQFQLKPGGHHIMFIDLNKKLENGSKAEVLLYFKKAGKITVTAQIKK
jgi:copper(I)-binding protein